MAIWGGAGNARLPFAALVPDCIFDEQWNREQTSARMGISAVRAARSRDGASQWRCLVQGRRNVRVTSIPGPGLACGQTTRGVTHGLDVDGNALSIGNCGLFRQGGVVAGRGPGARVSTVRGFSLGGRYCAGVRVRGRRNGIIGAASEGDDKMRGQRCGQKWSGRQAQRELKQQSEVQQEGNQEGGPQPAGVANRNAGARRRPRSFKLPKHKYRR